MNTRFVRASWFLTGALAVVAVLISGSSQATANTGRPAITGARFVGSINIGAEKYFTVNLRPGSTPRDTAIVANYFRHFGIQISPSPDGEILFAHGTYGQAGAAANTGFARAEVGGERFTTITRGEGYPPAVASRIVATTINDGPSMHPLYRFVPASFMAPSGGFTPAQVSTYYDIAPIYSSGIKGAGQAAAIFACATITMADITKFESMFSLGTNTPTIIKVDGGTTTTDFEPTGDIEREVATAPKESIFLYVVPADCTFAHIADGLAKIAADAATKHFKTVNVSYGATEDFFAATGSLSLETAMDTDLAKMMTAGATPFCASGDAGAFPNGSELLDAGELTVLFPASDKNALAIGGTTATTKSPTIISRAEELAWGGSGGGVSSKWGIPSWQVGVPGEASTTFKNVPDLALDADLNTGYQIVFTMGGTQSLFIGGGTSFSSPTWAGFIALVNSKRVALGKAPLTSLPTKLFAAPASDFFDVTLGCNGFFCAKAGFDNATGRGSFDAFKLFSTEIALP